MSILVLFFFSSQLIVYPEPAYAEKPCWNDGTIGYSRGGVEPEPPPCQPGQPEGAEPVNLATGAFTYENQDLFIPGRGLSINFNRYYNNQDDYDGPLGYGWNHSYNIILYPANDGRDDYVIRRNPTGRLDSFKKLPSGDYESPAGIYDILTEDGDNYVITQKHGTKYTFNSTTGGLLSIKDRNDNEITFEYDPGNGKLLTIIDTTGRQTSLYYNSNNKIDYIEDFIGRTTKYYYYPAGDLKFVTTPLTQDYPHGVTTTYRYDDNHNLTHITDPKGQTYLINHYDSNDRVDWQEYGLDTFYFSYDTENRITTLTDRKDYVTEYELRENGTPIRKTEYTDNLRPSDPDYYQTGYIYNDNLELTAIVYPRGNWAKYAYDDRGNILEIRRKKINAPDIDDPVNDIITNFTYEPTYNQVKTITDPEGNITTYDYYPNGNLKKITYPTLGPITPETNFTYTSHGQVETVTDPNGITTKYEYYPDTGYLKRIQNALGTTDQSETQVSYDDIGNVETVIDPLGNTTTFEHNELNQLVQTTSATPFNYQTHYFYDRNGNLERVSRQTNDPLNPWQTTIYSYDMLDHLKTIVDDLHNVTVFGYDKNENRIHIQDAEGNTTDYVYDERDLLWKVIQHNEGRDLITEYTYDENGSLREIKDANSNTTTYTYDDFDRLEVTIYDDSTRENFSYDKNSNLDTKTNRRGQLIDYDYDELNRLKLKTYPDLPQVQYEYDAGSRLKSVIANQPKAGETISYDYNHQNRVKKVTYPNTKTVEYEYDPAGNRKKLIYPDAIKTITYDYDELNRLTRIKNQSNDTIALYQYDALSRRTQLGLINGTQTTYDYDGINRLQELTNHLTVEDITYSYTYDNVGNRLTQLSLRGGEADEAIYQYDDLYQIKHVNYPDTFPASDTTYNYDDLGNRTSVVNNDTTTYIPNNLNQYDSVAGITYEYDNSGNLTSDQTNTYTYDSENRLITATTPTQSATYSYGPFGRRTQKNVDGIVTNYFYEGYEILVEYNGSGELLQTYIYGPCIDEPILIENANGTYYYHFDGLGSVTALSDETGNLTEEYSYDIFGEVLGSLSGVDNPYYFTARRFDEETELYYYRYRYYDPDTGRFNETDPIGYLADINLYRYCHNSPILFTDPLGLDVIVLNDKEGAHGAGHNGFAVGNDNTGWDYYSKNGRQHGNAHERYATKEQLLNSRDETGENKTKKDRYDRHTQIETSPDQDQKMKSYADKHYDERYALVGNNCDDLTSGTLDEGEVPRGKESAFPNKSYEEIEEANREEEAAACKK